jgi:hypothetical protein
MTRQRRWQQDKMRFKNGKCCTEGVVLRASPAGGWEFWESFSSMAQARKAFREHYGNGNDGGHTFRLAQVTYELSPL